MPYGYNGKILRVNLTSGTINVEEPGEIVYRTYLGGGGLASYYLLRELKPGITTHAQITKAFDIPGGHIDPGANFPMDTLLACVRKNMG